MVQDEKVAHGDGADEQMLGLNGVEDKLAERRDEVKFVKGDHQNGDAKIDIGTVNGGKPVSRSSNYKALLIKLSVQNVYYLKNLVLVSQNSM